jgi:ParB-like chromosome segregation protein Spo0J
MDNLRLESVSIKDLVPDPQNARKHDENNIKAIVGSLKLFGQRKPIVITQNNVIVAGNGTVEAAKRLNLEKIVAVRTPSDWSGETIKAYALADNRTAELAEWDTEVLADQLLELDANGFEVIDFGFLPLDAPPDPPLFQEDENQPRLDERDPIVCPECSFSWRIGPNKTIIKL